MIVNCLCLLHEAWSRLVLSCCVPTENSQPLSCISTRTVLHITCSVFGPSEITTVLPSRSTPNHFYHIRTHLTHSAILCSHAVTICPLYVCVMPVLTTDDVENSLDQTSFTVSPQYQLHLPIVPAVSTASVADNSQQVCWTTADRPGSIQLSLTVYIYSCTYVHMAVDSHPSNAALIQSTFIHLFNCKQQFSLCCCSLQSCCLCTPVMMWLLVPWLW